MTNRTTNRTRAHQIIVRMSDAEFDAYQKRLAKSKMSGNEYGLHCLLNKSITVIEDLPELMRQLKAIGNNLNQITRAANSGIVMPPAAIGELEKGVAELWQWLRR